MLVGSSEMDRSSKDFDDLCLEMSYRKVYAAVMTMGTFKNAGVGFT